LSEFCIGSTEVGDLACVEEVFLPFEWVGGQELRAVKAFDVCMHDGVRKKAGKLLLRGDDRSRVILIKCCDWRGVRKNDVGVGHGGTKR
jgi:hypothetical protein